MKKMTQIKHVSRILNYLTEKTNTYEWQVTLSHNGEHTKIDFQCGDFAYNAIFRTAIEASLQGILDKVVRLYQESCCEHIDLYPSAVKCWTMHCDVCHDYADVPYRDKVNGRNLVLCESCHEALGKISKFLAIECHVLMTVEQAVEAG